MSSSVDALINQVLQMPEKERALIAETLISSLEIKSDPDAEAAWCEEVQRRIEEIESGSVHCLPWENIRQRLAKNAHSQD